MEMLGEWDDMLVVIDEEIKGDVNNLFQGPEQQYLRQALRQQAEIFCKHLGALLHQNDSSSLLVL